MSRKKSPEFSARSGCSPRFIMCALRIILLSPVWRNISVRRTVATTWLRMSAENTLPGPTDGSWSASPTIMSLASGGSARSSASIRQISTIEHSSSITASQSSLSLSSFVNTTRSLSSSNFAPSMRCTVAASRPVSSVIRFAARPVGAHKSVFIPISSNIASIARIDVVLPVPGPPVMAMT